MMKKQFFRVKQLADQTFLKAEKSEILNHEELQIADQKIEVLRSALTAINKKLCPNGPVTDKEKRLRKCLEYQLGTTFCEESREERDCILLQYVLKESGRIEQELAKEYAEHEIKVEELVYAPLQKVLDHELPTIAKLKHNLKKYCLDKDSASNRYHATKKENLKEDMEEADSKVEQNRDSLATEMFNLLARENDVSSYILQLLKLQRGYHESALKNLETIIPDLEKKIGDSQVKRVFGISLQEHLRVTGKKLAYPLEICITSLLELGMSEEGLFRIGGGMTKMKRLKAAIDSGCFSTLIYEYRDVHVLASTLKLYLRELPEPLLTSKLYKEWMQVMQYPEYQRIEVVKHLLNRLPQENRDNLAYLIQFLSRLTQHTENKMTAANIAIVMAPNLLWDNQEEANISIGNCATSNGLITLFINEVDTLFPDDVSQYVTINSLVVDEDLCRNNTNSKMLIEHVDATSTESLLDSPKPNTRRKKPAAPTPPSSNNLSKNPPPENNHIHVASQDKSASASYHPSGSATLNRPHKIKNETITKMTSTAMNTEENELSLSRKRSLSRDDLKDSNIMMPPPVTQVETTTVSKTQPTVKHVDEDKNYKTTATHLISVNNEGYSNSSQKPVAAPRQSLVSATACYSPNINRNPSIRSSAGDIPLNKSSFNSLDYCDVQLRKTENERPSKPEIPARPASLVPLKRASLDVDPTLHKTSLYSVANKQQPSIVHLPNRNEKILLGHDVMLPEKEKFLGHQPGAQRSSLENQFNDINSNKEKERRASIEAKPPKPLIKMKSTEKLETKNPIEKIDNQQAQKSSDGEENSNNSSRRSSQTGHTRTRSDGNLKEFGHRDTCLQSPSSPRSLNKPTEPPPPPPITKKPEPQSTDF